MKKYLYRDLYDLEESHWWHLAKRKTVTEFVEKFLKKRSKIKILDIGCGTGKNLEVLSNFGEAWGLDNSSEAIKFCKNRGLKNVKLGSAENTKFPSATFDLITLLDVLEHTDDQKTSREIYRMLKPGGLLIVTVPAFYWLWSQWDNVLHHKRRYTKESLSNVLEKNGFKISEISYMFSFLILPVLIIRFIKSGFFKKQYPSDFKLSVPIINSIMIRLTDAERFLIKGSGIPFGTSLVCVAKKVT